MYPPLCGNGWRCVSSFSHGASLSPKRPRQDRRDSGVSAAMWEWLGPVHTSFSHGASLSPKRPRQDRRALGVSPVVWGDGGPRTEEAPSPMRWGPRCSENGLGGANPNPNRVSTVAVDSGPFPGCAAGSH